MEKNTLEKSYIENKKKELSIVKEKLKKDFIGIDDVIDNLISQIELWHIFPNLLTRPYIVCLWGLTGVGKTALVRKLAEYLDLQSQFLEVCLRSNTAVSYSTSSSIETEIKNSGVDIKKPSLLLLDEMQEFRTIEGGRDIDRKVYTDVWELLSDGKFSWSKNKKQTIMNSIYNYLYEMDHASNRDTPSDGENVTEDDDDEPVDINLEEAVAKPTKTKKSIFSFRSNKAPEVTPPRKKVRKYQRSAWSAERIQEELGLEKSQVYDIMTWTNQKVLDKSYEILNSSDLYAYQDLSNMMIIIAGNLDEAYTMSKNLDYMEIDADHFHEMSKKINFKNIKNALLERFKPEQVSRFGNNHIIYPSISKISYQKIIKMEVDGHNSKAKELSGVTINIADSVLEFLYRNSVVPVQGVRPVFSSVNRYYANNIPVIIAYAIQNNIFEVSLDMLEDDGDYYVIMKEFPDFKLKINGMVDDLSKNAIDYDTLKAISLHEAGHGLASIYYREEIPTELIVNADLSGGVTVSVTGSESTDYGDLKKYVKLCYAGLVIENHFLGKDGAQLGSGHDLSTATSSIVNAIRSLGLGDSKIKVYSPFAGESFANDGKMLDYDNSKNKDIESILNDLYDEAVQDMKELLGKTEWLNLFKCMVSGLYKNKKITYDEMKACCDLNNIHYYNKSIKDSTSTVSRKVKINEVFELLDIR